MSRTLFGRQRTALFAVGVALLAGCGPPPLTSSAESATALAGQVLAALARNDRAALDRPVLSEAEFRDHVWPHLPAARPERNLPFSYVWGDLRQKSQSSLGPTVTKYRDRPYELLDVRFDGERTPYADIVVHRGAVFVVREPDGPEDIRVCGSLLRRTTAGRSSATSSTTDAIHDHMLTDGDQVAVPRGRMREDGGRGAARAAPGAA